MPDDRTRLVEDGYDRMAEPYLASKRALDAATEAWLAEVMVGLPATATALDLGCGAGLPVTRWLAERATVIGVDVSAAQLALAGRHAPTARFVKADMATVAFPTASFDASVALYSIIHVPRAEHAGLLRRLYGWLRPGGRFLATWPTGAWEGLEADWNGWGAPMWWSHHDPATSLALLERAGFTIERAERRADADETWLWVVARKPPIIGATTPTQ